MLKILILVFSVSLILFLIPVEIKIYYEYLDKSLYKIKITYLFGLIKKNIDSSKRVVSLDKSEGKKIDFGELIIFLVDKGDLKKLLVKINIGFEDPCILGVFTGVVWLVVNVFLSYIFKYSSKEKIGNKSINVNPIFNKSIFELFFLCIIRVNIVYIITAYIKILKIRRGGKNIARASYRRFNAYNNE